MPTSLENERVNKMKIKKLLVLFGALCLIVGSFVLTATEAKAQVATEFDVYILTRTFPDTIHLQFGTSRDNWMTSLKMGVAPTTGSRVGDVTAAEVRNTFEVPDMCVSTAPGTNQWRGVFNPPAPYANMTGMRLYASTVIVPKNGQASLSGMSQRTLCDRIPLLNNQSAFTTNTYSVSRIGVLKGLDGILWTTDDQYLQNGEAGTILVDAIILIGSRLGAVANTQANIDDINTLITTNGATVTFEYSHNGVLKGSAKVMLYPSGGIPNTNSYDVVLFKMPTGRLFSLVGPPNSTPFVYKWTYDADQPHIAWNLANAAAVEGSSAFVPGNVRGYVNTPDHRISEFNVKTTFSAPPSALSMKSLEAPIPWATDDLDQDR